MGQGSLEIAVHSKPCASNGYDEGANYRITHHFRIEDEDYWAAWASDNSTYIELPPTEKRKVKGTWKDHNNRTQYILWWYPRDFTLMVFR